MTPKLIEAVNRAVAQAMSAGMLQAKNPQRPQVHVLAELQNYARALVQEALEAGGAAP